MHELSICEGILQIIEDQASEQGFQSVRTVWLEIGPFAGVELEALRFGFEVVARDTILANARLEVLTPAGKAWCMPCAKTITIDERAAPCPICGRHQLQITAGDELRIKELEVN